MLQNVVVEGLPPAPQIRLEIDREKAAAHGVTFADINATLSAQLGSSYVNDFLNRGRMQRVVIQAAEENRLQPDDLLTYSVRNASGAMVPFSSFARVVWTTGPTQIIGFNGYPAVRITGEPAPGFTSGQAIAEMERLAGALPRGFGYEWTGQSLQEKIAGSQAFFLLALSVLLVFLCLAALYESWSMPFAAMLVVPLGIVGSVAVAWMRGLSNDVYFTIGLITIIGLSAKNAILIIEFAKDLRARGTPLVEATVEAARLRLRPILMTSLAFILGVVPLVIASGASAKSQQTLGAGVLGGMITGTVLAIFMVPVFFVAVMDFFSRKGTPPRSVRIAGEPHRRVSSRRPGREVLSVRAGGREGARPNARRHATTDSSGRSPKSPLMCDRQWGAERLCPPNTNGNEGDDACFAPSWAWCLRPHWLLWWNRRGPMIRSTRTGRASGTSPGLAFRDSGCGSIPRNRPAAPRKRPLTPEYKKIHEDSMADQANGGQGNMIEHAQCKPGGMPFIMAAAIFEFIVTPETTYIMAGTELRRIFTDGRPWPTDNQPTYQGYSIGRWLDEDGDGRYDTLEVETRGPFKGPRVYDASGLPLARRQRVDDEGTHLPRQVRPQPDARRHHGVRPRADQAVDGRQDVPAQSQTVSQLGADLLHRRQQSGDRRQ